MKVMDVMTDAIVTDLCGLHEDDQEWINDNKDSIGDCPDAKTGLNGYKYYDDVKDIVRKYTNSVTVSPAVKDTEPWQWCLAILHGKLNVGQRVLVPLLKESGHIYQEVLQDAGPPSGTSACIGEHALRHVWNRDSKVLRRLYLHDQEEDKKEEQNNATNALHASPQGPELDHMRMILPDMIMKHYPTSVFIPCVGKLAGGLDGRYYCWYDGVGNLAWFRRHVDRLAKDEDFVDFFDDVEITSAGAGIGTVERLLYRIVVRSCSKAAFDEQKRVAVDLFAGTDCYEKLNSFFGELLRTLAPAEAEAAAGAPAEVETGKQWGVGGLGVGYYQQLTAEPDIAALDDPDVYAQAQRFTSAFLQVVWEYDSVIKLLSSHDLG